MEAYIHSLSNTTFRFVLDDLKNSSNDPATKTYLNEFNQEILDRVELSGEASVSVAVVIDTRLLPACIMSFRTTERVIAALPELVVCIGRITDTELRGRFRQL